MKKEKALTPRDYSFIREPFHTAVADFIEDCRLSGFTVHTIFGYVEGLRSFFLWFEKTIPGATHINDISRQVLTDYQLHLYKAEKKKGGKLSVATQHARMVVVLQFTAWLSKNEKILFDPGAGIHLPKRPKTLPRNYLSHVEINKLLKAPDTTTHLGLRNRAILETLYSTGIRNMELRNLKIADLNQTESWLTIRQGKGSKDRVVPIGKAALHFTQIYLEKTRPLFVRDNKMEFLFLSQHGEKLHPDTINQIINHTAVRAKIKRRISAHALRHTCATAMLRGRADIRHIQEMLGHKSLASTQIYTKVEIADLKRVHTKCHPREKEAIDKK